MLHVTREFYGAEVRSGVFALLQGCATMENCGGIARKFISDLSSELARRYGQNNLQAGTEGANVILLTAEHRLLFSLQASALRVDVFPTVATSEQMIKAESLLAALVRDMIPLLKPSDVHWLDREQVISPIEFLSITGGIVPRRVERPKVLRRRPLKQPDINRAQEAAPTSCTGAGGAEEELLRYRFRQSPSLEELIAEFGPAAEKKFEKEPELRRLSTWAITGVLAVIALPVAGTLAYLNLRKGENLRLNTHVLVLVSVMFQMLGLGTLDTVHWF